MKVWLMVIFANIGKSGFGVGWDKGVQWGGIRKELVGLSFALELVMSVGCPMEAFITYILWCSWEMSKFDL